MSSVHQFHEALNSLKVSDLRHFEELENALTTRKAHLIHLKQQCVGDLGADVFKNLDISQIIFKFKRESNRQDQVERNKRAVIHELNTLFEFNPPVEWFFNHLKQWERVDVLGPDWWLKKIPKSIDFYQYNDIDFNLHASPELWPHNYVFEVVLSDFCFHLFSMIGLWSVHNPNHPCMISEKWKNPIYTGNLHRTPLNNFIQWVLKHNMKLPNSSIEKADMDNYKNKYHFYNTQYNTTCPWFEFIQNNMRLE